MPPAPSPSSVVDAHFDGELAADYVVVGAGTAGLGFTDTLLTEDPEATIILVERRSGPGGHWTTAYDYVHLHVPSYNYGVNSMPLGIARDGRGREKFERDESAGKQDILGYYEKLVDQLKRCDRVTLLFSTEYADGVATPVDGGAARRLVAKRKVVTCVSNIRVPSMGPPPFDVADGVPVVPLNAIADKGVIASHDNFVVCGAGKSGVDAVCHLQDEGVDPAKITWIVPNDAWFIIRDGLWPKTNEYHAGMANVIAALGDEDVTSAEELFLKWEACDIVSRLRPDAEPPVIFKGATIYAKQLRQARAARAIRLGRVSEITKDEIVLKQGREPLPSNALVVDCTAGKAEPGAFFGYAAGDDFEFFGEGSITLGPLLQMLNPSATSAIVAYLEATFEDDATKNAFCYLPRGKYAAGDGKDGRATGPTAFLAQMYGDAKVGMALQTYWPALKFFLASRTNGAAPTHHGGVFPSLWYAFGPMRLDSKNKRFVKRVDAGAFTDAGGDCFGMGRPVAKPAKTSVRTYDKTAKKKNDWPPKPSARAA